MGKYVEKHWRDLEAQCIAHVPLCRLNPSEREYAHSYVHEAYKERKRSHSPATKMLVGGQESEEESQWNLMNQKKIGTMSFPGKWVSPSERVLVMNPRRQ